MLSRVGERNTHLYVFIYCYFRSAAPGGVLRTVVTRRQATRPTSGARPIALRTVDGARQDPHESRVRVTHPRHPFVVSCSLHCPVGCRGGVTHRRPRLWPRPSPACRPRGRAAASRSGVRRLCPPAKRCPPAPTSDPIRRDRSGGPTGRGEAAAAAAGLLLRWRTRASRSRGRRGCC